MKLLYDTDLMLGGGHVSGWLMNKVQQNAFQELMGAEKIRQYVMHGQQDPVIRVIRIFSALKDESLKTDLRADITAREYLLLRKPVSLGISVTAPDTAIVAVILAVIGKFYKSS